MKSSSSSYGSMAVLIHWISALLILVLFGSGFRSGYSESEAIKTFALQIHVPVAILVLLLTITRLVWWWKFDRKPDQIKSIPAWQNRAAKLVHKLLYILLFVLLGSGIAMSIMSGLPLSIFGGEPLPNLAELPPRTPHGLAARAAVVLVVLHAAAALHHHFVLKDKTLRRMWFKAGSKDS